MQISAPSLGLARPINALMELSPPVDLLLDQRQQLKLLYNLPRFSYALYKRLQSITRIKAESTKVKPKNAHLRSILVLLLSILLWQTPVPTFAQEQATNEGSLSSMERLEQMEAEEQARADFDTEWNQYTEPYAITEVVLLDQRIFVPLAISNDPSAAMADAVADQVEWSSYTNAKGGYSLQYPKEWMVEEEKGKPWVVFRDPSGGNSAITIIYFDFEIAENDTLIEWAKKFYSLGLDYDVPRTFTPVLLNVKSPNDNSEQIRVQHTSYLPSESYFVTNESLVMRISTTSDKENMATILRAIADSLTFATDAPKDQEELSYPDDPPAYTTFSEWEDMLAEDDLLIDALNYRMETGETPTHLLERMSEQQKEEYELTLERDADIFAEYDKQR